VRDIILIAIVAGCSITAIVRPVVGMLCFVWLGYLNPHGMAWGAARTLPLSQFAAIGTLIGYVFSKEGKRIPMARESVLLLALWFMFCLSTYFAIYHYTARESLIDFSKMLLMVFLCTALIKENNRLLFLVRVISLSLGFFAIKGGVFAIRTGGQFEVFGPHNSWLTANNSIGLALSVNIPILYYMMEIDTNKWCRRIYGVALALSYPAIICTFSRGAWLAMGVATLIVLVRHKQKRILIPAIILFFTVLGTILAQTLPDRVVGRYEQLVNYEQEGSAESRFWNWELCKRVGNANPVFGAGFEFYTKEVFEKYFPEYVSRWPGKVWNCHSIWYSVFAEHGYPGVILWVSLMVSCMLSLRRIREYGNSRAGKTTMVHYANMVEGALIAYMVAGTFLNAAYYDILYYLIGIIIILKERIRQDDTPADAIVAPA
jgi:probable O-glycosylation ligase (exosortase A-associated)